MTGTSSVPRFSDARVTVRWGLGIVLPILVAVVLVALLLPRPEPALAVGIFAAALLAGVTIFGLFRLRIPRVPTA
jgi:hypothetical protein